MFVWNQRFLASKFPKIIRNRRTAVSIVFRRNRRLEIILRWKRSSAPDRKKERWCRVVLRLSFKGLLSLSSQLLKCSGRPCLLFRDCLIYRALNQRWAPRQTLMKIRTSTFNLHRKEKGGNMKKSGNWQRSRGWKNSNVMLNESIAGNWEILLIQVRKLHQAKFFVMNAERT